MATISFYSAYQWDCVYHYVEGQTHVEKALDTLGFIFVQLIKLKMLRNQITYCKENQLSISPSQSYYVHLDKELEYYQEKENLSVVKIITK